MSLLTVLIVSFSTGALMETIMSLVRRRKARQLQAAAERLRGLELEAARMEERVAVLRHIKVFLLEEGPEDNEFISASKAVMALLGQKLCDYWGLKDTAEVYRKWGIE